MLHLHFTPGTKSAATSAEWLHDLSQVHELLGSPSDFPFFLIDVPLQPTRAVRKIEHLKKAVPETGRALRTALIETELSDFGEPHMRRIGANSD